MSSFATELTKLNTNLGDGDNFTFTEAEKTQALTDAYNDEYVWDYTYDTSLTTTLKQNSYTLPTGMEHVEDLLLDTLSDGYGDPIDPSAYRIYSGKIYFYRSHKYLLGGKTLIVVGKKKITTSDDLPTYLQDYVQHLAQANTISLLTSKKVNRFIKNDTTMSEMITKGQWHAQQAARLRGSLHAGQTARA